MKKHALAFVLLITLLLALPGAAGAAAKPDPTGLPAAQVTALIQLRHPGGLARFVRRVSDPTSPHYRDYATVESLVARFGAKPRTSRRVLAWLAARGVHARLSPTHMFITASLPSARTARLLSRARAVTGVAILPRTPLAPHAAVGPAPGPESGGGKKGTGHYGSVLLPTGTAQGCAAGVHAAEAPLRSFTPNQYLTAYGDAAMHARGLEGEGQTVALVESGGFKRADIVHYDRCFGVKRTPPTSLELVGRGGRSAALETTLDLEQLSVAAPGLDRIYVYATGREEMQAMIEGAGAALGDPSHRPDVISISFGICEPQLTAAQATKAAIDNVFAVAAGAGISVLVSSGDQGSTGCRGVETEIGEITALPLPAVELPSSSPYATAVGGTNLSLTKGNRIDDEIVWNDSWVEGGKGVARAGGGGISILSPRTPWWQRSIHRYGRGRKVPDLAALADEYPGYAFYCTAAACRDSFEQAPGWQKSGGTSAATPLTAAGIALANQAAARRGQPPLGFLNPLLYRLGAGAKTRAASFFDVTTGNNNITPALSKAVVGVEPVACCQARPGYDRASGWGSLKVAAFSRLALAAWPPRQTHR
jgi:subtilase family serine protease